MALDVVRIINHHCFFYSLAVFSVSETIYAVFNAGQRDQLPPLS